MDSDSEGIMDDLETNTKIQVNYEKNDIEGQRTL
jgi:hypothetical protein